LPGHGFSLPPPAIPTPSGKSRYIRYNVDYQVLSPLHDPLQTLFPSRYKAAPAPNYKVCRAPAPLSPRAHRSIQEPLYSPYASPRKGQFLGRDAALRRPVGAAGRSCQKLICTPAQKRLNNLLATRKWRGIGCPECSISAECEVGTFFWKAALRVHNWLWNLIFR
jgi:hypothetical protein